jgi:sec-independent protein translocase protein TatA
MANIGVSELIVILLILMLVFGASRLPALGEGMGKAIRGFKRAVVHNDAIEVSHVDPDAPVTKEPKRVAARSETHDDSITDAEIVEERKRPF